MPPEIPLRPTRLLRQGLESWSAAGVTHIAIAPAEPVAIPVVEHSTPVSPPMFTPNPSNLHPSVEMPRPTARSSPAKGLLSDPAATEPAPPIEAPLSREARVERLRVLSDSVRKCVLCGELAATRKQTVFGVGDPQAKILFIGEAPGADEDEQGEPFVGKAGQLLNQIISACKLKREQIYICNILKCRPPGNRTPLPDECGNCRPFLEGQLTTIDPQYIVCWGAVAAQNLLRTDVTIGKLRRRFHKYRDAKVLCTYHPSYLLRNPAAKKDVWEDMQFLFADMGIDLARKE